MHIFIVYFSKLYNYILNDSYCYKLAVPRGRPEGYLQLVEFWKHGMVICADSNFYTMKIIRMFQNFLHVNLL